MPNLWWFMNGISLAPSTFLYIELYLVELPNSNNQIGDWSWGSPLSSVI